jgi:hypothetical protein
LDVEEEYYKQAADTKTVLSKRLPSFEDSIGRYSPSGQQLRDSKDTAAKSTLVSTCVSDKDRVQREIQAVGASKTVCNDHTYAFISNYISDDIENAKCGHTIGVDTGEIASVAIVPNEQQIHYAHQAEQFSHRRNVSPKIHVSDICPQGIALWQELFRGVICRLGWFHFIQRITKTLRKEHEDYAKSIGMLQECVYWLDVGDLTKVKRCLDEGLLGVRKGKKCPADKILSKAKTYRENIRVWSYDEKEITRRLLDWLILFDNKYDENLGEYLFDGTGKVVREQIKKAKWVTDKLPKDELYIQIDHGLRSIAKLPICIGTRGAESKLEKGHHAIAHFANGGMRRSLSDFLGMAGLALYNLKIRHRLKNSKLSATARGETPTAFHGAPHFTNHLRLFRINILAKRAGLSGDVHEDVEILRPDNGERFFSEYLFQQLDREKKSVQHHVETNRCLCSECGGKIRNPYQKTKETIDGDTAALEAQLELGLEPSPAMIMAPSTNSDIESQQKHQELRVPLLQPRPSALQRAPSSLNPSNYLQPAPGMFYYPMSTMIPRPLFLYSIPPPWIAPSDAASRPYSEIMNQPARTWNKN